MIGDSPEHDVAGGRAADDVDRQATGMAEGRAAGRPDGSRCPGRDQSSAGRVQVDLPITTGDTPNDLVRTNVDFCHKATARTTPVPLPAAEAPGAVREPVVPS